MPEESTKKQQCSRVCLQDWWWLLLCCWLFGRGDAHAAVYFCSPQTPAAAICACRHCDRAASCMAALHPHLQTPAGVVVVWCATGLRSDVMWCYGCVSVVGARRAVAATSVAVATCRVLQQQWAVCCNCSPAVGTRRQVVCTVGWLDGRMDIVHTVECFSFGCSHMWLPCLLAGPLTHKISHLYRLFAALSGWCSCC